MQRLVDEHTDGRDLGVLGEPGVNVVELNLALDGSRRERVDVALGAASRWPEARCASTSVHRPGVGKTYKMLGEGVRRKERGTDVVIGVVETHGRRRPPTRSAISR